MNNKINVAIFDIDGTIIDGLTEIKFINYLHKNHLISTCSLIKIVLLSSILLLKTDKSIELIRNFAINQFKSLNKHTLFSASTSFYQNNIKNSIFKSARRYIDNLKNQNIKIALCTSQFDFIAINFLNDLNADFLIASTVQFKDDRLDKINNINYGKNKLINVLKTLDPAKYHIKFSFRYTDT